MRCLTAQMRINIVALFLAGTDVQSLADAYGQSRFRIEQIIRESMPGSERRNSHEIQISNR